ncbi:hypothetical protein FA13DRAFT_1745796 [Coprinellus micaceus]|uniref:Uncharacterized protein n=1 Tax=Coprinellus micaceus TaxID=71717 RepID=A0A4Y7SA88_COPMI|nr:hypothetical protein FA13DRAFT_1745796 [Coprinellus micaceus]
MTTSHQGLTLADLEWGLNSNPGSRFALAAMYGLQVYEWFDCIGKEIKLGASTPCPSTDEIERFLDTTRTLELYQNLIPPLPILPLLCWPVVMWAYMGNHSSTTCAKVGKPVHILLFPYQCFSQGVMLMRAYAFTGRDRRVLMLLCTCYAILLGVNFWRSAPTSPCRHQNTSSFLGPMGVLSKLRLSMVWNAVSTTLEVILTTLMDLVSLITGQSAFKGGSLAEYFIGQVVRGNLSIHMLIHRSLGVPSVSPPDLFCNCAADTLRSVRFGLERMEREDESERDVWLMDSERATDSSPQDSIIPSILPRHCTVT